MSFPITARHWVHDDDLDEKEMPRLAAIAWGVRHSCDPDADPDFNVPSLYINVTLPSGNKSVELILTREQLMQGLLMVEAVRA